jgi:arginyl-tRNA---protein transferase
LPLHSHSLTSSFLYSQASTSYAAGQPRTTVQICGSNKHDCGYCRRKGEDTSCSFGVVSENMNVRDYQSLMLIGWRRCGTYYYKPTMHDTCCPMYTIRLPVAKFKESKSQRHVRNKVTKLAAAALDAGPGQPAAVATATAAAADDDGASKGAAKAGSKASAAAAATAAVVASHLTVELEEASFTKEKYDCYRKYQIEVHNDKPEEVREDGFRRFLVDSSLVHNANEGSSSSAGATGWQLPFKYGTHHQLYRLHGKLIGVGVVDILPLGVSSVYFFYDGDYKHFVLGKYSALQEIELCKKYGFLYYYMGFYIHNCEKMKYKAEYQPSELLCPTSLNWVPFFTCKPLLDRFSFTPFVDPALKLRLSLAEKEQQQELASSSSQVGDAAAAAAPAAGAAEGASTVSSTALQAKHQRLFWPKMAEALCKSKKGCNNYAGATPTELTLDIGAGRDIKLGELRPNDIARLQGKLAELLANVGAPVSGRLVVKLC